MRAGNGGGRPANPPLQGTLDPKLQGKPLVRPLVQDSCPTRQIEFTSAPDGTRKATVEFDAAACGKRRIGLSQTFNPQLDPAEVQATGAQPGNSGICTLPSTGWSEAKILLASLFSEHVLCRLFLETVSYGKPARKTTGSRPLWRPTRRIANVLIKD
jgi:hypothetical protein